MAFDIYDYRADLRNVVITPAIRSRFLRMEPGAVATRHSHDLGYEVFLVLEGQAEFEIGGARAVLGPGQMCFARRDELHSVRVVGGAPMTMYLSVTPHIEPTHTFWDEAGTRLPRRYGLATSAERATPAASTAELADRLLAAAQALADAAGNHAEAATPTVALLKEAATTGDMVSLKAAVDTLYDGIYQVYRRVEELAEAWNDLAPLAQEAELR